MPGTDETDDNSEFLEPVGRNSAPVSRLKQRPEQITPEETKTVKKKLTQQPIRLRGLSLGRVSERSEKANGMSALRSRFSNLQISSNKSASSKGSVVRVQTNAEADQLAHEEN
jgi:hypothetical protein